MRHSSVRACGCAKSGYSLFLLTRKCHDTRDVINCFCFRKKFGNANNNFLFLCRTNYLVINLVFSESLWLDQPEPHNGANMVHVAASRDRLLHSV
jgi:hypothetical protein